MAKVSVEEKLAARVNSLAPGNTHEVKWEEIEAGLWMTRQELIEYADISHPWSQRLCSEGRKEVVCGKFPEENGQWFISVKWAKAYKAELDRKAQPGATASGKYEVPTKKALRMVANMVASDTVLDDTTKEFVFDLLRRYKEEYEEKEKQAEMVKNLSADRFTK